VVFVVHINKGLLRKVLVIALTLSMLLGIIQFTVIASDEDDLAELADNAVASKEEAQAANTEITGPSGYEQAANDANTKMENTIADVKDVINDVQEIIDEAKVAISGINNAEGGSPADKDAAAGEFESKFDEAVTAVNDAILDVQGAINEAEKVVNNTNKAVDAAANAVAHAQDAMDFALQANDLYLKLLEKAEDSIDAAEFAQIAQAEKSAAAAWNAFVDQQNVALKKVQTAADKAEEAKNAADILFIAWLDAVKLVNTAVQGTSIEALNELRDRALLAAVDAREYAINAVLAANALLEMAENALDILDKTDLFDILDGFKLELDEIHGLAEVAVDKLTVKEGTVIVAPSTAGLVALDFRSNSSGNYDAGGGVIFVRGCPILQLLNDNDVRTITLHYAGGETKEVSRNGIGRTFNSKQNIVLDAKKGSIIISFVLTSGETVFYKLSGNLDDNNFWNFNSGGTKEVGQEKVVSASYEYLLKDYSLRDLKKLEASLKGLDNEILARMQRQELDGLFDFFGNTWQWTESGGEPGSGEPGGGGPGGGGPGGGGPGGTGGPGVTGTGLLIPPPVAILTVAAVAGAPTIDDIPDMPAPQALSPVNAPQDDATILSGSNSDYNIVIDDAMIPHSQAPNQSTWALWNLILSIASAVLVLIVGARALIGRKKEDEDNKTNADSDERKKRGRLPLIAAIPVLAIVAIIIFILTQDMTARMIMADIWTIAHAVLFAAGLLSFIFAYKSDKDENSDSNLAAGRA